MLQSMHYSVKREHAMVSRAFLVTPTVGRPDDDLGLLPLQPRAALASEVKLGLELLTAVAGLHDLDRMPVSEADLKEQMIVESLILLGQAYPADNGGAACRSWLGTRCQAAEQTAEAASNG